MQAALVGLGLVAGYVIGEWWWGDRDRTPLAEICARIDYINALQNELKEQRAASEEVRDEFKALIEQCRIALGGLADESD